MILIFSQPHDLFVSIIEKDATGNDVLKDIESPEEKAKIEEELLELYEIAL